jgi:hypothetical protein
MTTTPFLDFLVFSFISFTVFLICSINTIAINGSCSESEFNLFQKDGRTVYEHLQLMSCFYGKFMTLTCVGTSIFMIIMIPFYFVRCMMTLVSNNAVHMYIRYANPTFEKINSFRKELDAFCDFVIIFISFIILILFLLIVEIYKDDIAQL